MKKLACLSLLVVILLSACASAAPASPTVSADLPTATARPTRPAPPTAPANTPLPNPQTVTVMAASSLANVFNDLKPFYEAAHPGATLALNYAGSQQLLKQLTGGAAADVFASAGAPQMDAAVTAGLVDPAAVIEFARNRLVIIFPKPNPAKIQLMADLARPGIKLVLAAKEVPAGQYTLEFLDKTASDPALPEGFKDGVLKNVVSYEESVRAVLTKVSLGEADAGIVYLTDVMGPDGAKVEKVEIPEHLNVEVVYLIAPLKQAPNPDLATAFIQLITAVDGQKVLEKYYFELPAQ